MKKDYEPNERANAIMPLSKRRAYLVLLPKVSLLVVLALLTVTGLNAQSGGWDSWATNGTAGNNDYGNGVIRLLSDVNTGCAGAAVHETSVQYDPTVGNFNQCYQVFFGCPGNDNIGSDANGDGMAFSFSKCAYNINNGLACGGGLGYMGSCAQMFTIEFDTYSSAGGSGFDGTYGGGTTGFNDEIALHRDGIASDAGRITSATAGNLEDGLEHTVCINYNRTTHILTVSIDAVNRLVYDLTGSPYELATYFGAGGLNQTWSSGKFGATNPATVSNGANIAANLGGATLCPAGIEITSPAGGTAFSGCPVAPITITATATPPAGNTVTYVEFFVDGLSIGSDFTANYSMVYNSPTQGVHALTSVAHWSGGGTTTSSAANITVGGSVNLTSTAPTIDATVDALWASYSTLQLNQASGGITAPDLDATYKITYNSTKLFLLVDVIDDVLIRDGSGGTWEDDGIEIFIDIGNDKSGGYGANDFQYSFNWNNGTVVENKHGATGSVVFAQTNIAGGYRMEIEIPWATLLLPGGPAPGTQMGFDVKVNDDDNSGTRDSELSWNDGTFGAWNNTSLFGTHMFSSCDPLPISLLAFSAECTDQVVLLSWITALELDNKMFVIERSTDLINWTSIGDVKGSENSSTLQKYNFKDYNHLQGVSYYRLKQIDVNGSFMYSSIATVEACGQTLISIAPNPFDDVITITGNTKEEINVLIFDVLGRVLFQTSRIIEDGTLTIPLDVASGTYVITIQTNSFVERQKIVKK